ncbi:helix-hairpin-helix domain-containing protein [Priestia abyssalis]|uniref:helix-hairpin-helix domain-containing protein n=1 Tax=Priestia abyssalis TaxID=1221450 RepID=UPI001F1FA127|nr:helix-hairpin-helix domain-containing protein [Priestia abyssalis]
MAISKRTIIFIGITFLIVFLLWLSMNRSSSVESAVSINEWEQEFQKGEKEPSDEQLSIKTEAKNEVIVDVKGEVQQPGVYEMRQGDRVTDAIASAGGFRENADQNQVNLAGKLKDEMVIYVPKEGEILSSATFPLQQEESADLVNINSASSEELQSLPGIGPAKAEAIITYREEQGGFEKTEDLMNVSGIGEKSFEKIQEQVTIQ